MVKMANLFRAMQDDEDPIVSDPDDRKRKSIPKGKLKPLDILVAPIVATRELNATKDPPIKKSTKKANPVATTHLTRYLIVNQNRSQTSKHSTSLGYKKIKFK